MHVRAPSDCPSVHQMGFWQALFGNCNARYGLRPTESPDLTSADFSLWGFLTETVYSNNPRSLEHLKHNSEQTVAANDQHAIQRAARRIVERANASLQDVGRHFQHLL